MPTPPKSTGTLKKGRVTGRGAAPTRPPAGASLPLDQLPKAPPREEALRELEKLVATQRQLAEQMDQLQRQMSTNRDRVLFLQGVVSVRAE